METISEQIILNRYEFTQEFKDQVCFQVLYECQNIDKLVKKYELPSNHTGVFAEFPYAFNFLFFATIVLLLFPFFQVLQQNI